jgi:uncharacterized protein YicC (UPF0701 family)
MSDLVIILNKQIEELQAALEAVVTDDIRWMREVLQDYRIRYDDHSVGRRIALTTFIYGLKEQIAALTAHIKELTEALEKIATEHCQDRIKIAKAALTAQKEGVNADNQ